MIFPMNKKPALFSTGLQQKKLFESLKYFF